MEDKNPFDELLEQATDIALQLMKYKKACSIVMNNTEESARVIKFFRRNNNNPHLLYVHYITGSRNPLPQEDFECLKEVLLRMNI